MVKLTSGTCGQVDMECVVKLTCPICSEVDMWSEVSGHIDMWNVWSS